MSTPGQTGGRRVQKKSRVVGSGTVAFADGQRETPHIHGEHGQLKWPSTGLASVHTPPGIFVAPPTHAVWIPAGDHHAGHYTGSVLEQNLYVHASYCTALPARACLVAVSPRLASTIAQTVADDSGYTRPTLARDRAVLKLLEREIIDSGRQPLPLPFAQGSDIERVLDTLLGTPSDRRTIADWARELHVAERSFVRAFTRDTGISFGEWRKRARVLRALQRLAVGADIATIAQELGYESKSAFVYMFRTTLATTPARYFERGSPISRRDAAAASHPHARA
jgi:AraC-like DNA-binding protein